MREILFRGKRKRDGKWVYGAYLHLNAGDDYICDGAVWIGTLTPCKEEVIPETVGQFTGLTDKDGKKIFEGDILTPLDDEIDFIVEFNNGCFNGVSYAIKGAMMEYGWDECAGGYGVVECEPLDSYHPEKYHEVIGNIHDNPELLEANHAE